MRSLLEDKSHAIKAGHVFARRSGYILDLIQTGGVSSLNNPPTKIYELANYQTVATLFDIPDLSFDLESWMCLPRLKLA